MYWHGARDAEGRCSQEVLCLVNPESDQCKSLQFTKDGVTVHSVNENGDVFQCDSTNTDGDCSYLTDCYGSSLFPNCKFFTTKSSAILADPSLISNANPAGLEDSTYMIFYSDDECQEWEGLKGVTSGEHVFDRITDDSVSCSDALACVFHSQGDKCQTLDTTNTTTRILTQVTTTGTSQTCDEAGVCQDVDDTQCVRSTIAPSCYVRMTSAQMLVSQPQKYLTTTATTAPTGPLNNPLREDTSAAGPTAVMAWMGAAMAVVLALGAV